MSEAPRREQRLTSCANAVQASAGTGTSCGISNGPQAGVDRSQSDLRAQSGCSVLSEIRAIQCCNHAASGQISAKSNRGRVIGGMLALSRQRSLNRSSAFSTTMASNHAGHRLSSLANTR